MVQIQCTLVTPIQGIAITWFKRFELIESVILLENSDNLSSPIIDMIIRCFLVGIVKTVAPSQTIWPVLPSQPSFELELGHFG